MANQHFDLGISAFLSTVFEFRYGPGTSISLRTCVPRKPGPQAGSEADIHLSYWKQHPNNIAFQYAVRILPGITVGFWACPIQGRSKIRSMSIIGLVTEN